MTKHILATSVAAALFVGVAHAGPLAKSPFSSSSATYVEPERKSVITMALDLLGLSTLVAVAPQETPDMTKAKPAGEECETEISSADGEKASEEDGPSEPTKAGPEPFYLAF